MREMRLPDFEVLHDSNGKVRTKIVGVINLVVLSRYTAGISCMAESRSLSITNFLRQYSWISAILERFPNASSFSPSNIVLMLGWA